ncbi:hypothetical protein U5801_29795, partial [Lamprobacter modestohalophilus]|uniref:hypothetical protein n=1 Tax=Lamprobacter modestohalophilus TaxID=1064514 RepID=UPI002ADEAD72
EELKTLLRQDTRKIIITTIFKFGEETPRQTVARLLKQIPELVARGELVVAQQELGVAYRAVVKIDDSNKREEARDALRILADTHRLSLTAADSDEDPQETALIAT